MMLTRLDLRGAGDDLAARLPRPSMGEAAPVEAVREILAEVRKRGDAAVREYTERFDGVRIDDLRVPPEAVDAAVDAIPAELRAALEASHDAIIDHHRRQLRADDSHERDGLVVRDVSRPVERAGAYVPGGRARYPSTVLMTALPARVAGVGAVVLCVPPGKDGAVATETLAAAALAGVGEVYRIGGVQAIGALAYGTETVVAVDVIVGPGNAWVATAKREVASEGVVGVPAAFAGPSEVMVIADESVSCDYAAMDLIVQAEHGPDGLAWLVTWSEEVADSVGAAVERLTALALRRDDIEATLRRGGYAALVDGPEQAMAVANLVAPEHLELMTADPEALVSQVRHAGAVFCGPWSPASLGDYIAGPSHVLPTFGSARYASGLSVDDFIKRVHVVTADRLGLDAVARHVVALAKAEGLDAHAESVLLRQQDPFERAPQRSEERSSNE
jgi:histidinol dehydrogenase